MEVENGFRNIDRTGYSAPCVDRTPINTLFFVDATRNVGSRAFLTKRGLTNDLKVSSFILQLQVERHPFSSSFRKRLVPTSKFSTTIIEDDHNLEFQIKLLKDSLKYQI